MNDIDKNMEFSHELFNKMKNSPQSPLGKDGIRRVQETDESLQCGEAMLSRFLKNTN